MTKPRVAWAGSSFVVFGASADKIGAGSFGAYTIPSTDDAAPVYTPWLKRDPKRDLMVDGAFVWHSGLLHVAMLSYPHRSHHNVDMLVQLVHADLQGHVTVEPCPEVKVSP